MNSETHTARPRLDALDGLRTIAVFAVLIYHVNASWLPGGYLGVDIFFVISGYLITSSLIRDHSSGGIHLLKFWTRRFRRLLPALWAMVLVITAVLVFFPPDMRAGLGRQLLGAFTYTSNWLSIAAGDSYFTHDNPLIFVHLWSLAIEEQFYLVWPFVVMLLVLLRRRWGVTVSLVLAVTSAGLMAVLYRPEGDPSAVYFGTHTHVFGLMLGAALAFARPLYSQQSISRWRRDGFPVAAVWVNVVAVLLTSALFACLWYIGDQTSFAYRGGILLASAITLGVISSLGDTRSVVTKLLSLGWMRWLGQRSYGIYLWHWPLILIVRQLIPIESPVRDVLTAAVATVLTVMVSAISFRMLEQPIIHLGFGGWLRGLRSTGEQQRSGATRMAAATAAAVVSVLAVVSILQAPEKSSAQTFVEAGAQYAQTASAQHQLEVQGAPVPEPLFPSKDPITSVTGDQMLAVGDSVMLASAGALQQSFPGIKIDAEVARQSGDTLAAARRELAADRSRRVVVIHTGTNGSIDANALESFVSWAGPNRRVILVDVFAERSWQDSDNAAIRNVAQAHPQTVAVAEWHAAIQDHTDELASDRIHPGATAASRYSQTIIAAMQQLGVSVSA